MKRSETSFKDYHFDRNIDIELAEILGRCLTNDELDHCWVKKHCSDWGFINKDYLTYEDNLNSAFGRFENCSDDMIENSDVSSSSLDSTKDFQQLTSTNRFDFHGESRYIARLGKKIEWELVDEYNANKWQGVLLIPEKQDKEGKICCVQFPGKKLTKIWISIDTAMEVLKNMQTGLTLTESLIRATK